MESISDNHFVRCSFLHRFEQRKQAAKTTHEFRGEWGRTLFPCSIIQNRKYMRGDRKMGLIHISDEQYENLAFCWGLHYDLENKVIYGERKGYPFLLYISQASAPLMFTIITSATSGLCPQIGKSEKKLLKDRDSLIRLVTQRDNKITVLCANILDFNGAKKAVDSILSTLVSFLKEKEFVPCCENCKRPEHTQILLTGYEYRHLCPQCEKQLAAQSSKELLSDKSIRKNGLIGIVCAVIGALFGIAFMVFLFVHAGNIMTFIIAGIFLGAATVGLGLCLGNRPHTAVKAAVAAITVLAVFVGYNASYVMAFAARDKLSVLAAVDTYFTRMLHGKVHMDVWIEYLVILYIAAAVGGIVAYRSASKGFGKYCKVAYIGRDKT